MSKVSLTGFEVLELNAKGLAIGIITPEKMFGDLATWKINKRTGEYFVDQKSGQKLRKMKAYVIDWPKDPNGCYNTNHGAEYMTLVDWDVWQQLEPSEYDIQNGLYVCTGKKRIKIPRVVQTLTHDGMPNKRFKVNLDTIYDLYGGKDAYTNEFVPKHEANLDHVIARSKGGKRKFGNIVLTCCKTNTLKSNKNYWEVGLPAPNIIIPSDVPMYRYLRNPKNIPEWALFLRRTKHKANHE